MQKEPSQNLTSRLGRAASALASFFGVVRLTPGQKALLKQMDLDYERWLGGKSGSGAVKPAKSP